MVNVHHFADMVIDYLATRHWPCEVVVSDERQLLLDTGGALRHAAPLFTGKVDCLSISLNTDDAAEYLDLCRPKFGATAYPALLAFTKEAAAVVPEVVMTVVGEPVTSIEKQASCRVLAESLGARLRVRPYEAK